MRPFLFQIIIIMFRIHVIMIRIRRNVSTEQDLCIRVIEQCIMYTVRQIYKEGRAYEAISVPYHHY